MGEVASEAPAGGAHGGPGAHLSTLVVLFWGLQSSFFGPTLALMLVALYHATPEQVGVVLMVYNAAAFVAALLVPGWADRRRSYLPLTVVAGVLNVLLVLAMALSHSLLPVTLALVVLGAPAGVGITLVFAHLRHAGAGVREVMNTRAMLSLSWVAGPPLATFIIGLWGDRSILFTIAAIGLFTVLATIAWSRHSRLVQADATPAAERPNDHLDLSRIAVVLVVAAWVLLQATNSAAMSSMNLFVTGRLHLPVVWGGITLAVAAGLEVPAMTLVGRLSQRVSMFALVVSGCLAGLAFYGAMVVVHHRLLLVLLQVLNAWFVAVVSGLGLTLFQQIIARPGLASGIFTNTRRVGNIVAGPVIALAAVTSMGYGIVFVADAAITALALALLLVVGRRISGRRWARAPR